MKAAALAGVRTFEMKEVARPEPGPGEALVRVRSVGVCGSDLHFYRGEFPVPAGFVPGHECAGEVAALGEGVTGFEPGDQVALELFTVCLRCEQCRSGNYHLCPSRKANGLNAPGGLREYMTVPAYAMYRLPEGVDCELGALCEPLAVTVHGLRLADLRFGERVAVLGSGTIGLMAIAAAKAMGATWVGATARHPQQRAMASAVGADAVFGDGPDDIAALTAAAQGADVVVETVGGHANTLQEAITVVGTAGRVCVLGAFTQPVTIHPITFFIKEVRLFGSNCYGRPGRRSDYELAIEIMRRNAETLRRLITHRFPLERVAEAYATADDKRSGAIKVQVTP
ncbi:MAG TPA: alcohol dehydrogenase catalytic domain-containing protein [Dehalococcoidia bacterium]|nr:alcohol dehydrogenase catalytic domain-containing protein [Dehalococcoidia bacterium]